MGQFSVTIYGATGAALSDIQQTSYSSKPVIGAIAAKWRFVRKLDLGHRRWQSQLCPPKEHVMQIDRIIS